MRKLMVFMAAMGILFLSGCTDNTESSISKDSVSEIESSAVQEVPPEESVDLEESPLPDAVVPDPLQKMDIQICVVDQEGNPAPNIETTLSYYLPTKYDPDDPPTDNSPIHYEKKMDIQICVVDQEGNPAPNIETTLSYYLPTKYDPDDPPTDNSPIHYEMLYAHYTDQNGLTPVYSDIPATLYEIRLSNHSLPHEEEPEMYYVPAEELVQTKGLCTVTWHGESYRSASEQRTVAMAFRALNENGEPIVNAKVSFYSIRDKNPNSSDKYPDYGTELPIIITGWTDPDGRFYYAFPSASDEHVRDGFSYHGIIEAGGKKAEGDITLDGGYTELVLTLK